MIAIARRHTLSKGQPAEAISLLSDSEGPSPSPVKPARPLTGALSSQRLACWRQFCITGQPEMSSSTGAKQKRGALDPDPQLSSAGLARQSATAQQTLTQQTESPATAVHRSAATQQTFPLRDEDEDLFVPLAFAQRIASAAGAKAQMPSAIALSGAAAPVISNTSMPHSLPVPLSPDNDDQVYDVPDLDPVPQAKARWP